MEDFYLYEQGSMAIVETRTQKIHGPFHDDDEVQAELYLLKQQGIPAIAVQIIGDTYAI